MLYNACFEPRDLQPKGGQLCGLAQREAVKAFLLGRRHHRRTDLLDSNNTGTDSLYPLLILPAAIVIWTLMRQLQLRYTKLSVSGGKLRYETGMMSRSVRTMEVSKVQDVRVDQSFMDRLLNLGTIAIETAGEASGLTMAGVEDPQEVADSILEAARK